VSIEEKQAIEMPIIHMNGTHPDTLIEGYLEACRACNSALETFRKVEFNARDYYPKGDEAWAKASQQHQKHFKAVSDASEFFFAIVEHCHEARPKTGPLAERNQ
jgi:hypothetical protein